MLTHSCTNCGVRSCGRVGNELPEHCQTAQLPQSEIDEINDIYNNDEEINKIFVASTETEITSYGILTRVEEIMAFARRIEAKKIGIAACAGLMRESQTFARILEKNGFVRSLDVCYEHRTPCYITKIQTASPASHKALSVALGVACRHCRHTHFPFGIG